MAGCLPKTRYLLTDYNLVIGSFDSLADIAYYLGVKVKNGYIFLNDKKQLPEYSTESFNEYEMIRDWAKCYMRGKLPSNYCIYRYLV